MAPAIANAVQHAIGVRVQHLPITAEKVYQALKEAGNRGQGLFHVHEDLECWKGFGRGPE